MGHEKDTESYLLSESPTFSAICTALSNPFLAPCSQSGHETLLLYYRADNRFPVKHKSIGIYTVSEDNVNFATGIASFPSVSCVHKPKATPPMPDTTFHVPFGGYYPPHSSIIHAYKQFMFRINGREDRLTKLPFCKSGYQVVFQQQPPS